MPAGLARPATPRNLHLDEDAPEPEPTQADVEKTELDGVLTQRGIEPGRRSQLVVAYQSYRGRVSQPVRREDEGPSDDPDPVPFDVQAEQATQAAAGTTAGSPAPTGAPTPGASAARPIPGARPLPGDLLAVLPAEWVDYLQGVDRLHAGDLPGARAAWERLLARPQAERLDRSTWAAYMLARTLEPGSTPAESAARYQRVRTLHAAGCRDGLDLAGASLGWEARLALNAKDYGTAVRLYYQQAASGTVDGESLKTVAEVALGTGPDDPVTAASARDPFLRRVVTLYVACHRRFGESADFDSPAEDEDHGKQWLAALKAVEVDKLHEAASVAWATYQKGDYAGTAEWLRLAPADQPLARWLRAKLLLRAGKDEEAAREFAGAVHAYPAEPSTEAAVDWAADLAYRGRTFNHQQFQMDFGIVQLSRGDYEQALTALLRSGFWRDAAYVAEDVLSIEELSRYVREHYPQPPAAKPAEPASPADPGSDDSDRQSALEGKLADAISPRHTVDPVGFSLRYLLGRRLARLGRYPEARTLLPAALLPKFDQYVAASKVGESGAAREKRAAALWEAAKIERWLGMEMFGTEVQPDWFVEDGDFEDDDYRVARAGIVGPSDGNEQGAPDGKPPLPYVPPVGAGEKRRVARDEVKPPERYHYRYLAAELAWKAAGQMPDQTDDTAKVLASGGAWLQRVGDDDGADRFQRTLVRRCGQTALGQESAKSGRLPDVAHEEP